LHDVNGFADIVSWSSATCYMNVISDMSKVFEGKLSYSWNRMGKSWHCRLPNRRMLPWKPGLPHLLTITIPQIPEPWWSDSR